MKKISYIIYPAVILLTAFCILIVYSDISRSLTKNDIIYNYIVKNRENAFSTRTDTVRRSYRLVEATTVDKPILTLNALTAAVIDGESGRVLYSKDGTMKRAMASTTKIMTCIIALENGNPSDEVTVSGYAATMPDVQLNMKSGDRFKLEDLLYSLMLESHNDTAVAIAEHIGGSVEGFAELMNEKAGELGLLNTHFVTPNGLDAENHYSTAIDMCILGNYAIRNKDFIRITNTRQHIFKELNSGRQYSVSNKNSFLNQMEGAIGIKTGFTGKAGYCFVGAVKDGDKTLVSSVLASGWPPNKTKKWSDTGKLMNYAKENFKMTDISFNAYETEAVSIIDGVERYAEYSVPKISNRELLLAPWDNVTLVLEYKKQLSAPVTEGELIGELSIYINDERQYNEAIKCTKAVEKIDFNYIFESILDGLL